MAASFVSPSASTWRFSTKAILKVSVSGSKYVGGYWHFAEPLRGRFWMISDPPYCIQTPPTGFLPNLAEHPLSPRTGFFCLATCVLLCFHCTLLPWGSKTDPPYCLATPPTGSDGNFAGRQDSREAQNSDPPYWIYPPTYYE